MAAMKGRVLRGMRTALNEWGALLEALPDPVVVSDTAGRIMFANERVELLTGHTGSELHDQLVEVLVPERFRRAHEDHRSFSFVSPATRDSSHTLEISLLHKDGSEIPIEITLSIVETALGPVVVNVLRSRAQTMRAGVTAFENDDPHARERVDQTLLETFANALFEISLALGEAARHIGADDAGRHIQQIGAQLDSIVGDVRDSLRVSQDGLQDRRP